MSVLDRDLTPADLEVLEFERAWWRYQGRREAVVRTRFGYSLTRHIQRVLALIDHPQALEYNPVLVRQLRERRDARKNERHARRHGFEVG